MQIERRFSKVTLRSEEQSGKHYISGHAALYDSPSQDLGGFTEVIRRGAFTRALKERQDVRALINHDASLIVGRTKSGTLQLSEDGIGLRFRVLLPATGAGDDLAELVTRGDLDECSFAFRAVGQSWTEEKDGKGETAFIRELLDVDLLDVSVVTYPAYLGTDAALGRSLFPDGVPLEVRSHLKRAAVERREDQCECDCEECLTGYCVDCSNEECTDKNCRALVRSVYDRLLVRVAAHGLERQVSADDSDDRARRARELALAEARW